MNDLLAAVGLLTRLPVGRRPGPDPRAVAWFPVVGLLVGAVAAGTYRATVAILPPAVAALLAVAASVIVTGGLHEDGLGDAADAFAAHADRRRRFEIMDDPRLGTYGVIGVVLSVSLRAAAVAAAPVGTAVAALLVAHPAGRAAAALVMSVLPAARPGLGAGFGEGLGRGAVAVAVVAAGGMAAIVTGVAGTVAVAGALLAGLGVGAVAGRRLGGFTGDVLGAAEQAGEVAALLVVVGIVAAPWWA